jgi:acetaldehyde dehydrogenase (acetylating)
VLEFGLHKPAFRICVNTSTTHGSIGLTTGLDPAMTLGCGGFGGNITSDNISPRHLLNIKRLAYETRPVPVPGQARTAVAPDPSVPALPTRRAEPPPEPIARGALAQRIDRFLASRGIGGSAQAAEAAPGSCGRGDSPESFVCEEDVRQAIRAGRKIVIGERTIVTPAARDAGEAAQVFVWLGWPP